MADPEHSDFLNSNLLLVHPNTSVRTKYFPVFFWILIFVSFVNTVYMTFFSYGVYEQAYSLAIIPIFVSAYYFLYFIACLILNFQGTKGQGIFYGCIFGSSMILFGFCVVISVELGATTIHEPLGTALHSLMCVAVVPVIYILGVHRKEFCIEELTR